MIISSKYLHWDHLWIGYLVSPTSGVVKVLLVLVLLLVVQLFGNLLFPFEFEFNSVFLLLLFSFFDSLTWLSTKELTDIFVTEEGIVGVEPFVDANEGECDEGVVGDELFNDVLLLFLTPDPAVVLSECKLFKYGFAGNRLEDADTDVVDGGNGGGGGGGGGGGRPVNVLVGSLIRNFELCFSLNELFNSLNSFSAFSLAIFSMRLAPPPDEFNRLYLWKTLSRSKKSGRIWNSCKLLNGSGCWPDGENNGPQKDLNWSFGFGVANGWGGGTDGGTPVPWRPKSPINLARSNGVFKLIAANVEAVEGLWYKFADEEDNGFDDLLSDSFALSPLGLSCLSFRGLINPFSSFCSSFTLSPSELILLSKALLLSYFDNFDGWWFTGDRDASLLLLILLFVSLFLLSEWTSPFLRWLLTWDDDDEDVCLWLVWCSLCLSDDDFSSDLLLLFPSLLCLLLLWSLLFTSKSLLFLLLYASAECLSFRSASAFKPPQEELVDDEDDVGVNGGNSAGVARWDGGAFLAHGSGTAALKPGKQAVKESGSRETADAGVGPNNDGFELPGVAPESPKPNDGKPP